ncbi:hypothetical protein BDN72DRAFT_750445, partial [Pluteus cervinus]
LLLWIFASLTPQEIREKLEDNNGPFQKELIAYLESVHQGEYFTGQQDAVLERIQEESKREDTEYQNPTETLPIPPPAGKCKEQCSKCQNCIKYDTWHNQYLATTDDLILKSNIHKCGSSFNKDGSQNKTKQYVGCMDNKWGKCRARFPRQLHKESHVDRVTGTLFMKKLEPWINTFTPALTYLFRCNTDVTSLKSGTAIKAVTLYVSNYITKTALKTHVVFDSIRSI